MVIKDDAYTKLKECIRERSREYVPASPEMIIAARCQEPMIQEEEILLKSNVFSLGLLLLEVCTLKAPSECYDLGSYTILDEVVTARIEEIEELY
jgi:hypothetical protein